MWCIQTMDATFRACTYDILDLYQEPYDPKKPLLCLDEKPKQLLWEKRTPIPMKLGIPERYDYYEYVRNGTANIFMAVEFKAGKRVTQVTERRTTTDFALFVKMLVDEYPYAESIRLVTDNLTTHKEKSFYDTFSKDEAERMLSRVEFHYTPKHASWLNAAEIEISVMDIECIGRRIGDRETLSREVAAWTRRRNHQKKKIDWKFTREKADKKLSEHYVP